MSERVKTRVVVSFEDRDGGARHEYNVIYAGSLKRYIDRIRRLPGPHYSGARDLTIYFPTEDKQGVKPTSFHLFYPDRSSWPLVAPFRLPNLHEWSTNTDTYLECLLTEKPLPSVFLKTNYRYP